MGRATTRRVVAIFPDQMVTQQQRQRGLDLGRRDVLSVVATFLLDLSRRGRVAPETPLGPSDRDEVMREVLEGQLGPPPSGVWTIDEFLRAVACLGGFPGWNRRRRPGWITIWRGWQRLMVMVRLMSGNWCVCLAERPRSGAMSRHKAFAHGEMRVRRVQYQVSSGLAPTSYPT